MKIHIVNPGDRDWTRNRYILWFGAYASTYLMVWANSLDAALDEAVDWIAEHKPGLLADEEVAAEYARRVAAGEPEDIAYMDTTCAGNAGHYLNSWEWGIAAENPTREQIKAMQEGAR